MVCVRVVLPLVLLVEMICFKPIEVHCEAEPDRVSEARDHKPTASISERWRMSAFFN
jgi:hypothetical protein